MARLNPVPTQDRLKELLDYDAETGILTRKEPSGSWSSKENRKYGKAGAGRITELGYVMIGVDGINYNAGALAWMFTNGEWPVRIKYLNGQKTDNRLVNLAVNNRNPQEVAKQELTQGRLKELVNYDPETGWITWRVLSSTTEPGERAGGLHGFGYRQIGLEYKKFLEHQLAWLYMTGEWPTKEIDHINSVRSDNRWCNLREATRSQNGHNKQLHPRSTTGFTGVSTHGNRYRSTITVNGTTTYLGRFKSVAETRIVRLLSERDHFGQFTSFKEEKDCILPLEDGSTVRIAVSGSTLNLYNDDDTFVSVPDAESAIALIMLLRSRRKNKRA